MKIILLIQFSTSVNNLKNWAEHKYWYVKALVQRRSRDFLLWWGGDMKI